jgi:hypothetical protein
MATGISLTVGPQAGADGAVVSSRAGKLGDQIVSELHGRFYEQNYRGALFSGGMTTTSISNATFTTATTGATATPIVGVWNPSGSTVNLVILQATMVITLSAGTSTGGGTFQWVVSTTGQNAISTGGTPWNRKTLSQAGSIAGAKNMAGVALTGLSGSLSILGGSALAGGSSGNFSFVGTAAGDATTQSGVSVENLDGSIIVPPGMILGLFCTTTPVAHSAGTNMIWEEVPL